MANSAKKAILLTLDGERAFGYLPAGGMVNASGDIELLDHSGRLVSYPLSTVLTIFFVREFNLTDRNDPERLGRRTFQTRPRTQGLWLRVTLLRGDPLEGLAPLDLSLLDGLLTDRGLHLTPPDTRGNTQRIYIPRSAISGLQLIAVIGNGPRTTRPAPTRRSHADQAHLFPHTERLQSAP